MEGRATALPTAVSLSLAAADPTLDQLDGSRDAQVTVYLGPTALQTVRVQQRPRPRALTRVLGLGWVVLALSPVAALFGAPGLTAALALLGAACGLLGTLRRRAQRVRTRFTVGAAPGVDLPLGDPALQLRCFPLVTAGPTVHFLPWMAGELVQGHLRRSLDELETGPSALVSGGRSVALPPDAWVELRLGQVRVEVLSVAPPRRLRPAARPARLRQHAHYVGSFALHGGLLLAALLAPPLERPRRIERVQRVIHAAARWVPSFRGDPVPFHPSFVRARDPFIGNTRDDAPPGLYALRGPVENRDPHLAHRVYRQGGAGAQGQGGGFGAVRTVGDDPAGPRLVVGPLAVRGALSRELVRRVVQRNLDQAYLCLLRQRPVGSRWHAGVVRFEIGADGRVRRAWAESSADKRVMACLTRTARRWLYPRPYIGKVTVRLPLVYRR